MAEPESSLDHPSAEELRALSLGQLAETDLARVSSHIGECPACCHRIDELADDDRLLARLQQSAGRGGERLVSSAQRRSAVRALRRGQESRSAARQRDPQAAADRLPAPRTVGDYDILAEVGRGGMGVVYKARHRGLHRLVALKMVLAGEFASPTQELRFRLEAELAARVQHPNIVQVYEIGSHERRPFLALEWVEGGSLADRLDGTPWSPADAAALIEALARAIHVAHAEGIVHRDLKPANILLARPMTSAQAPDDRIRDADADANANADRLAGWTCKIADFGLARTVEGGRTVTQSGFLVGTPQYMAPEQAGGRRDLVGPATDTYTLGVILYQLLTGQPPFSKDSTMEVLRAVTSDEPARPRRLQPRVPRDLEGITLHCLEKEPTRRYPSALALAEDLARFREGKPVAARPVGAAARFARACRRRPLVALLFGLLAASLLGGLGGVTWKWLEANEQRDRANTEKQAALYEAYRARLAAAGAALQNHDVTHAAHQLERAPAALRGWEWRHLQSRLDDSSAVLPLPAGGAGFLLGAPHGLYAGTLTPAGLRLMDLERDEHMTLKIGPEPRHHVTTTQTRRGLRVVAWVGKTAFDLLDETGQVLCRVETPEETYQADVVVSPDGTRVACHQDVGEWTRLLVFDATSGRQTALCDGHRNGIRALAFSPDGVHLVSGGEDRTACLWDPSTGALLATYRGHGSKVVGIAYRPDGARLATASSDGTVRQWDPGTGREVETAYDRHSGEVLAAAYSPDGQWIASAGTDRTIRVWRASGRQDVAILHGHEGGVNQVAFAPDGRRLASLSGTSLFSAGDGTVRIWDVDPKATLPALRGHTRSIYPVAFSPDGRWLASGSWDSTVRLWDAETGEPYATLPHPGVVWALAFGPDGRSLLTGTNADNRLRIWDAATARVRKEIQGSAGTLRALTVSPDGTRVAASTFDNKESRHHLLIFDLASGDRLFSADGRALAYSPDGGWLAFLDVDDRTVHLLDTRTHQTAARFSGHEKTVYSIAFSPDGRRLASCSGDRTVRLWEIDGGAYQVLQGHTDEVFTVAFHPDGTRLASGGRDRAVWLWDLAEGEAVAQLPGHTSFVWSLAFSPDGQTLASGAGDATVRLWDTSPLKARHQARRETEAMRPEAARLVQRLVSELHDPAQVVSRLHDDGSLSAALRRAALHEVLRRHSEE